MDLNELNTWLAERYFEALGRLEAHWDFDETPAGMTLPAMPEEPLLLDPEHAAPVWESDAFAWDRATAYGCREFARKLGLDPDAWQAPEHNPLTDQPWQQGTASDAAQPSDERVDA